MLERKKIIFLTLLVVVLGVGLFLRVWHFSDWLHFELDQSRDAKVVDLAIEQGIGNLPLLGPKAAGSFLRLGPIFYYFEYLSALVFGNTPAGIATLNLIFSILTIPLFYFFVRRFFNRQVSLMTTALLASSFFLIMYGRFAWNPNALPLFVLAAFYALLRAVDREESRRGWWLLSASIALSVATQFHFIAFLALPVIVAIFLVLKRPRIKWFFWLASLAIILILYVPTIINDFKTGGSNIKEFAKVFEKKSADSDYTLIEKTARSVEESTLGYFLILTGYSETELPKIIAPDGLNIQIICADDCKKGLPMGLLAGMILFFGVLLFGYNFIPRKEIQQHDFLTLVGIWFLVSLGLFAPIAYDLAPRFFLLVAPLPFIFFAFILDFLEKRRFSFLAYLILSIAIGANLFGIWGRFQEFGKVASESFKPQSDRILKEKYRVTLGQQLMITDYIESIQQKNKFPVYVNSEPFYRRAFLYHLDQRKILRDDFRNAGKTYQKGNYFLIYPALSNLEKRTAKYLVDFTVAETKEFGTLKVFRLVPKPESIKAVEQIFGPEKKPTSAIGVPVRCRWNEIFGQCNSDGSEDLSDEGSEDEAGI